MLLRRWQVAVADVLTTAVFWGAVTRSRDLEERCWIDYGEPWFVVGEVLAPELVPAATSEVSRVQRDRLASAIRPQDDGKPSGDGKLVGSWTQRATRLNSGSHLKGNESRPGK